MTTPLAISLRNVSKRYRMYAGPRERLRGLFGLPGAGHDFWALRDIDMDITPGTALGVLGRNGAGKSTLLRTISGVLQPSSGTVTVNGRLIALFQLGAGFNDEFTGRENILLNGLILGIDRREMLERFDEIAAFADIGEFIDQPIKTYSSGMRGRLGFAVAVNVQPDILVVDETLSAGDAVFKARGIQKMRELREAGVTIVFVTHSTNQVRNFCTEAALLHKGRLVDRGETGSVIEQYEALVSRAAHKQAKRGSGATDLDITQDDVVSLPDAAASGGLREGSGEARIERVEILDESGTPVETIPPEAELTARVHVRYEENVSGSAVAIAVRNEEGLEIFATDTSLEKAPLGERRAGEAVIVDFTFAVPLKNGPYSLGAAVARTKGGRGKPDPRSYLDRVTVAAVFKVTRPLEGGTLAGLVHLPTRVEVLEPDRTRDGYPFG